MKKLIMFGLIVILSHSAYANEEITKNDLIEGICGESADYALQVMHKRQTGVTITEALKEVNQIGMPGPRREFFKAIVYSAYKEPRITDEKHITTIESEFSNKTYLSCAELWGSSKF
ncbi:hypothetical protein AS4_27930 [Acinetobacter guillouiae]|uniref:hypothetical protein n=1 Tax=Acinetobacter guillouiae TaxID=106649 RepID=UPI0004EF5F84|nr:hypothetical protein [Acinetobacter guillouiae]BAP37733.1 hypothetical protein AS4_27930 [Acinetobacter guillouiae]